MNSRQRVLTALSHCQPDRTPADFWAEPPVIERLLKDFNLRSEDDILELLNIDIRCISSKEPEMDITSDGVRRNYWGERWSFVKHDSGSEWLHLPGALASAETLEDLRKFEWPSPNIIDYSVLPAQLEKYKGYSIRYGSGDIFTRPCCVRGMETFLMDLAARPDIAHFIIRKFTDFYCEDLRRAIKATGGDIDIFMIYSDLGCQLGPLISKPMFDEFFAPYAREIFDIARQAGIKAMLHSCGSVRRFIPDLMNIGVDILNPIQVQAQDMVPVQLKAEFGSKLSFHGAIDEQEVLPKSTPDEVRHEVRTRVAELGQNGGYIICATHNIQLDTPNENILAMYDVALR